MKQSSDCAVCVHYMHTHTHTCASVDYYVILPVTTFSNCTLEGRYIFDIKSEE